MANRIEAQAVDNMAQFRTLVVQVKRYGLNLEQYRESFLMRRIGLRMKIRQIDRYSEYLSLLDRDTTEQEALKRMFSVNVTEFFRDKELFQTLRQDVLPVLRSMALAKKEKIIKVWCAGCASGEEPYSVAMMMLEELGDSVSFEVIATDRNPDAIEKAKIGKYHVRSLYKLSSDFIQKYFLVISGQTSGFSLPVKHSVKRMVHFVIGDISVAAPPTDIDVIFCRNVMIYMSEATHQKMFQIFYSSLRPSGYLVLGQSEMILGESRKLFEPAFPKERIYVKAG